MNPFHLSFAVFLCSLTMGCGEAAPEEDFLSGDWKAYEVTEEGRPLKVNPEEIRFTFFPDHTYLFHSTLNYREAGRFSLRENYLTTIDTLAPGSEEKTVEITQLVQDTLQLRMMDSGKERKLLLVRTQ